MKCLVTTLKDKVENSNLPILDIDIEIDFTMGEYKRHFRVVVDSAEITDTCNYNLGVSGVKIQRKMFCN